MQFITHGPEIPDQLLQAHEDGRVVFFCGAGISYPAGLLGFKGLVKQIYKLTGTTPNEFEQEALDRNQFDAVLDLLEHRLPGQRKEVRNALARALSPKLSSKGATETHQALLQLACTRDGALRLVTTNFDRVFHSASNRLGLSLESYVAPMLPIPKNSRWNGLVYLHGLLPAKTDETALNRLVVTSGDFGLAYLTERWAARFVSELLRNYVVCFVGYSINDPVLRYMMDALAADRMRGEITPQAWAFADCDKGMESTKAKWNAKHVTPILYDVPPGSHNHSALHNTLRAWAETYRDGILGKERIVVSHALSKPSTSTQQDDFVGRMLWALSDKSGLPAKSFANFNPTPSLDWLLEAFSEERFRQSDLIRFGISPCKEKDYDLRFSLIQRPTPYHLAPQMLLSSHRIASSQWDDVMFHLAHWLIRHLDDPRLIIWIAQKGGHLHDRWVRLIENELNRFSLLEREGKTDELEEIKLHAPKSVPGQLMRTLWRLLLSGRVKSTWHNSDLFSWKRSFMHDGLTATLRLQLRDLLAPQVALKKPFRWEPEGEVPDEPSQIKQLVAWELKLATNHVKSALPDLSNKHWNSALPQLIEDFQILLSDALNLLCELGEAENLSDRSHWDLPSISPHWQNRGFRDWVILIELLRDAWLEVHRIDRAQAARIAQSWFYQPFPTFKRLALFAASQEDCITTKVWVEWLLADDAWWLWSIETRREVFRTIVLQGGQLTNYTQQRIESAILLGPPRNMHKGDLEPDQLQAIVARAVWLRLAKLAKSGLKLGNTAARQLAELSDKHPHWQLADDERDEFSHWMSGTGDPDYKKNLDVDIAPRKRNKLVNWLKNPPPKKGPFYEDTWQDVCRTRFFHALYALHDLSRENQWPEKQWREALQTWSEEDMVRRSWQYAAPLVGNIPDSTLQEIVHSVTWWMNASSKVINTHEEVLIKLCRQVMTLQLEVPTSMTSNSKQIDQPVTEAINHPIGTVTQTLLNLWLRRNPSDNDLLPNKIKPFFTQLCYGHMDIFRHARVLLGSHLVVLFRVDQQWTEEHLLPHFSWSNPEEAKAVWEGFLWSPRLYQPLITAFKTYFLESASHYAEMGEHSQQFAAFLTYAALGPPEDYTVEELRCAFSELPQEGLENAAQALHQALEGAGDQRENYWQNRVRPFWQNVWPKSREQATPRMAESLAQLSIAARNDFPAALTMIKHWLQPIQHPDYVVHPLYESKLCNQFPADALHLLNAVISNQQWAPEELSQCLDKIVQAAPQLEQDSRYRELRDYSRIRGLT